MTMQLKESVESKTKLALTSLKENVQFYLFTSDTIT